MKAPNHFLNGSEFVLVAQVPRAGGRWHQVHFNAEVMRKFFRLDAGTKMVAEFERVTRKGAYAGAQHSSVVYSTANKNFKIEFDLRDAPDYPSDPPLLLILEIAIRRFRFVLVMPGDPGYEEMKKLNASLPKEGRGLRRGITTLAEVEMRWGGCPLRSPRPS
jgi:hypothetical protein